MIAPNPAFAMVEHVSINDAAWAVGSSRIMTKATLINSAPTVMPKTLRKTSLNTGLKVSAFAGI